MTPAEQKQAEANGAGLREIKSEVASNSSSEELPPFQKRSRRKECIYITIAVILGAGLIAVLVYFSVTNALKESEPKERKNTGAEYSTTESTTSFDYSFDYQSGSDYDSSNDQAGSGMTRDASAPNRMARKMDPGSLTRGAPGSPDDVQADTQISDGTGQSLLAGGKPDSPNDEQADTQDAEGAVQPMTKVTKALPGMPEQGDGTEADESENMDQNSQPADNVDGSDAGFVKQAKTPRLAARGVVAEGEEGGNTEQGEQVEDTVKENPEQNFHLADNREVDTVQEDANQEQPSGIPQKMEKGVLRPPTQETTE